MTEGERAPLRVVIADDHYLVREGTRELLELDGSVKVVACVADAEQLVAAVAEHAPDAVITDIRMPPSHHLEGIEAALRLRRAHAALGIVVLSSHADADYALALFADGMQGLAYLLKERVGDRNELLEALRRTVAGDSMVDPVVVAALVSRHDARQSSGLDRLTDRERDVLADMAAGRTNAAIGEHLHLSVSAVEKHINAIFTKLDLTEEPSVHRRVAAVLAYLSEVPGR